MAGREGEKEWEVRGFKSGVGSILVTLRPRPIWSDDSVTWNGMQWIGAHLPSVDFEDEESATEQLV